MRSLFFAMMLVIAPLSAVQADDRVFRVAELGPSPATLEYTREVTLAELAKLGFVEGRNLRMEEGPAMRMPSISWHDSWLTLNPTPSLPSVVMLSGQRATRQAAYP